MTRRTKTFAAITTVVCLAVTGCQPSKQVGHQPPKTRATIAAELAEPQIPDVTTTAPGATTSTSSTTSAPGTTLAATTTTVKASNVVGPTTTAKAPTTNTLPTTEAPTTSAPTVTTPIGTGGGCQFGTADRPLSVAFCETFDAPKGNGSRTGDLDPVLWGVSRIGMINPGSELNDIAQFQLTGCGTTALSFAPSDVRICNGQLFESVNDGGAVASLHTYPKQPFDWAGRTGTVVFDVSGDSDGSHGAWPEFVITDKPVPGTRADISASPPNLFAYNQIGFTLDGCDAGPGGSTGVGRVFMARDGVYSEPAVTQVGCISKGSHRALNHIEVRVSKNRIEVWGTDAGGSALRRLAYADNLDLKFTKGLVWMDDVHYNARKAVEPCECGTQWNHTFVWDNLGFDGPKTYRDLGFDVPEPDVAGARALTGELTRRTGFQVGTGPTTLQVPGVRRDQAPTGAYLVLNSYSFARTIPSISINGNAYIDTPYPAGAEAYYWQSVAIPIPVNQVRDGNNTVAFKSTDGSTVVSNISIILVAGAPVP